MIPFLVIEAYFNVFMIVVEGWLKRRKKAEIKAFQKNPKTRKHKKKNYSQVMRAINFI